MTTAAAVKHALSRVAHPEKAAVYRRFFKTAPGEYGAGDAFLGVTMPEQRAVAKRFSDLSFPGIERLLGSGIHEHRMTGLLILTYQYADAEKQRNDERKKDLFDFYLRHLSAVNNWDLVDVTVPRIVGSYLREHQERKGLLSELARSKDLWERRVAVLACFPFIRNDDFVDILALCELLLDDEHDLIHKATGWMLREVGKRGAKGERALDGFLRRHVARMPRTMLRYAIERFPEEERRAWLRR